MAGSQRGRGLKIKKYKTPPAFGHLLFAGEELNWKAICDVLCAIIKACVNRPLLIVRYTSAGAVQQALERNPLFQSGQPLQLSVRPDAAGMHDPH